MTRHNPRRSLRLVAALRTDRVERRLGRQLTDEEFDRLRFQHDPLALRETWIRYVGPLEVSEGRLTLGMRKSS